MRKTKWSPGLNLSSDQSNFFSLIFLSMFLKHRSKLVKFFQFGLASSYIELPIF